ncbi:glycoside hydrolase family 13 protein [Nonomuraea sediminis]|uniref:glycoside hydrolase family 13 protein n=1 Tax=Nonomuraea sediminis TaxID=2835864 RepID=UPI001BDD65D6|nr:glycoside hydrolase family 13 protein [Nonomuraea sediminis]
MTEPWWRQAVIYQVYLRSFADSDGDGVGDLEGLRGRLDYLRRLGVDGIWLNPCYPSPGADHGYDVSDYMDIDPLYGGLSAWDRLLSDAHARGLKVLMDLVPNHCSVEHPWFKAALAGDREMRDRFIFRRQPNNWQSIFGGPAWTRVDDEWYLHSFAPEQPDFNWRNPAVAEYFDQVLRFWFDRGVDGIRIDVAHMMYKQADLLDWPGTGHNPHMSNQPEVHEVLRRWRRIADGYARDLTLVGEIWVPTVDDLALFLRPDELPQAFYFDLLMCPWDAGRFRDSITRGLSGAGGTWTLANHDVHRSVSRYGLLTRTGGPATRPRGEVDVALGVRRARAAALLTLALPGSVYLYQGEEAGLPEVLDLPDSVRQDPTFHRSGPADYGRDGCRVPLPWTSTGPSFGFSASPSPWLPQPRWFADYAIEDQIDLTDSTWTLHHQALTLRRTLSGPLEWLPTPRHDVLAFRRGSLTSVTVFGDAPYPTTLGTPALASTPCTPDEIPGNTTAWFVE